MKIYLGLLAPLLCFSCLSDVWPQGKETPREQSAPSDISLTEAEILVYLLPQARQIRKIGMDIGWELETGTSQNTADFYTFWVINNKRQGHVGSVTIGYFSVNKHTADLWNLVSRKPISDDELNGIQKILRDGHHIDSQTIEKYRNLSP